MNPEPFYQTFSRIINNQKHIYSSKDLSSTLGTPKFYETYQNYIVYELNDFVLRKLIVEKDPNPVDKINQYLVDLFANTPHDNFIAIDKPFPAKPTRVELSSEELLKKRDIPMYYTINEEIKILDFGVEDFKKWFKNEIIALLDIIELYKKNFIMYTVPKSISSIHRTPTINNRLSKEELDNELYSCYKRIICLYSVIATDVVHNKNKRKEVLTQKMDKENVIIDNFIADLVRHYPSASFGSQSSKRLHDVILMPEGNFAVLGNNVVNCLSNFLK